MRPNRIHLATVLFLFVAASEALARESDPNLEPGPEVLLTVPLAASPLSQTEILALTLSYLSDGSLRVSGELAGINGDEEIFLLIDPYSHTYTATAIPQDPTLPPMYVRFGKYVSGSRKAGGGIKGGGDQPLLPEDPPDPCCPYVCSGQHYAYIETREPLDVILARTEQNSYWEIGETLSGQCNWGSRGNGFCSVPPGSPTRWFNYGCPGSYPSGHIGARNVHHWSQGDYINWDFLSPYQETTTHHNILIQRSGVGGQTVVTFSSSHSGEAWVLLSITVGQSGRNDC